MASIDELLVEMKGLITACEKDNEDLKSGKKASGARVRKSLMSLKTTSHKARGLASAAVKAIPVKSKMKESVKEKVDLVEDEKKVEKKVEKIPEVLPPPPELKREVTERPKRTNRKRG